MPASANVRIARFPAGRGGSVPPPENQTLFDGRAAGALAFER